MDNVVKFSKTRIDGVLPFLYSKGGVLTEFQVLLCAHYLVWIAGMALKVFQIDIN